VQRDSRSMAFNEIGHDYPSEEHRRPLLPR
jgi:hypothetical protein